MIVLVSQSGLAITESAVLRRSASRGASSPLARSSLPRISRRGNGDISRIFQGHFTGISGIFRLSSTWHSPPPYTLALLAGDEHYSSLLAVWNFEHYHASHFPHAGTILEHLALFLWHHSSPLGDSYSGFVQAQDAPVHLDLPVLRRYSQIGVGSGVIGDHSWPSWSRQIIHQEGGRGLDDSCLAGEEGKGDGICFSD